MDHERARKVMQGLNRKLFLLRSERKAVKRREILDSILKEEIGQLKKLLELKE
jgi:hypothetical protein